MAEPTKPLIFDREDPRKGRAKLSQIPKGSSGNPLCRRCGTECPTARRTFCSEECVHEWKLRSSASYARRQVWLRDCGICALCGIHADQQKPKWREYIGLQLWLATRYFERDPKLTCCEARAKAEKEVKKDFQKTGWNFDTTRSWWQMDHITPVVEGGGLCGMDGFRTLCLPCHKKETAALRARLKQLKQSNDRN